MLASHALIERAMQMRCDAYMSHVKHVLLMRTIFEIDGSRRALVKSNKQLADIDKVKTLFIASMSHELNTPLACIIGYSEMILKGKAGPVTETQLNYLQSVVSSAELLKEIVADAMDIAKIESGIIESDIETFNLSQVIIESIQVIQNHADKKCLTIKANLEKEILMTSDLRRLKQCLINLLSNAVKYTEKGYISVEAINNDSRIEIIIRDTGVGLSEDDLTHVFDVFRRADSSVRTGEKGSGIGLHLTKKLVQNQLKGEIEVKSELNKGSIFKLVLPQSI
jgi:signal transduction histidine kinase